MMVRRSIITCLLLASSSLTITSGFVVPNPVVKSTTSTQLHHQKSNPNNENNNNDIIDTKKKKNNNNKFLYSDRAARVTLPFFTLLTTTTALVPKAANAGIGTIIPFEETRKEKFAGSISNSVVLLRLKSTLRKRGYYANKAAVGTWKKEKDDLSVALTTEFGSGKLFGLLGSENMEEFTKECEMKPHALILYGKDVSISPSGEVGETTGDEDLNSTEQKIMAKLNGKVKDFTLVGGTVIHRTKSGGKDAGEDCFLPASIVSVTADGVVTDLFEEVFGDLPTSRQTVVLR